MGELNFYFGTMNSGKSLSIIGKTHMIRTQGKPTLLFKCVIDGDCSVIKSRGTSNSLTANPIYKDTCLEDFMCEIIHSKYGVREDYSDIAILIDECQFLTTTQVTDLVSLIKDYNLTVSCYGLKNTYVDNTMFNGSLGLLYYADNIIEMESECHYCKNKAIMNMRVVNDKIVCDGNTEMYGDVQGSSSFYITVCRDCYLKSIERGSLKNDNNY